MLFSREQICLVTFDLVMRKLNEETNENELSLHPLLFKAHSSNAGVFDEIHSAVFVSHRGHILHYSCFFGGLSSPGSGILFHPEVFQGGLQVSLQCICCRKSGRILQYLY